MRLKFGTCWSILLAPAKILGLFLLAFSHQPRPAWMSFVDRAAFCQVLFSDFFDVSDETIRAAFRLNHQFLHDGDA
jgi:hypothetical protein